MASETILRTRALSLSSVATTSTIRLPKVLPSRIIATVEIVLSTSFCAVPALSRVQPETTSPPTTTATFDVDGKCVPVFSARPQLGRTTIVRDAYGWDPARQVPA